MVLDRLASGETPRSVEPILVPGASDLVRTDIRRYSTYMVKKLTRTGNSVALVLDKEILEATGLDAGSTVEVSTDGRVIIISPPAEKKRSKKVDAILGKLDRRYGSVFKKLAE